MALLSIDIIDRSLLLSASKLVKGQNTLVFCFFVWPIGMRWTERNYSTKLKILFVRPNRVRKICHDNGTDCCGYHGLGIG